MSLGVRVCRQIDQFFLLFKRGHIFCLQTSWWDEVVLCFFLRARLGPQSGIRWNLPWFYHRTVSSFLGRVCLQRSLRNGSLSFGNEESMRLDCWIDFLYRFLSRGVFHN